MPFRYTLSGEACSPKDVSCKMPIYPMNFVYFREKREYCKYHSM